MPFTPSLLVVVSEVFEFQDGTLHFSPAVLSQVVDQDQVKAGDRLELRKPDGTVITTTLYGLDWFTPSNGRMGLSLSKPLTKTDIPTGTEIWKVG